jgi:hypothetical protein
MRPCNVWLDAPRTQANDCFSVQPSHFSRSNHRIRLGNCQPRVQCAWSLQIHSRPGLHCIKKSDLDSKPPPFWTRLAIRLTALHHCPNFTTQPLSWFRHDQEHRFSRFAFVEESAPAINNKNLAVSYNCRVSALSEQF